jgi:vitamin B12 transporter
VQSWLSNGAMPDSISASESVLPCGTQLPVQSHESSRTASSCRRDLKQRTLCGQHPGTSLADAMIFDRLQSLIVFLYLVAFVCVCQAQTPTEPASPQGGVDSASSTTTPNNPITTKPALLTVVTVTGEPLAVSLAPASASVVDEEHMRDAHALTSADIMRAVPFVNLLQNGAAGSLSTVTIRGGKPNQVLVMIDGIPANDLSNLLGGAFDFSSLLTHDVERIEVVSGPLSSGYGSEAMSGVVNVITKPTHYESNLTGGLETGSFGTAGMNLGAQGLEGRLGYKLSGSFLRVGEQVESDAFSTSTFSVASDYSHSSNTILSWTARWIQFDRSGFPEGGGGPEISILRTPKTSNSGSILGGFAVQHHFNDLWTASIDADVFSRGEHAYTPPILDSPHPSPASQPSTDTRTRFTRSRLTLQNVFSFKPKLQSHFSVQGADEIGSNNTIISGVYPTVFNDNRGIFNASGDLVYSTPKMTGMAALGINKTAGFNVQLAPRVGAAVPAGKGTIIKASWGQAFNVPSLFALGNPNVGNPNLLPEKLTGMDAGVEHRFGERFTLSGTYYYNLFSDLIDFSAIAFRLVNRSHVRTEGVETATSFAVARWIQVRAWGSFLDWAIEPAGEPLRDQPDWQAGLSLDANFPKQIKASSTTLWVGRRYDFQVPAPTIPTVGGYSTTNLVVGYYGFRHTSLFARIDNLFNARFHEYLGFPNPGIAVQVGIQYRLR